MISISKGIKIRGSKYLYEGNYSGAIECFYRVYLMEPDDIDNTIELIYTLNQNGDYGIALSFIYALLGEDKYPEKLDTLYFFAAEAFGGAGCIEACVQMLIRCIHADPAGPNYRDAVTFLRDVREKYIVGKYDENSNCVTMNLPNAIADSAVLNYETLICVQEAAELIRDQKLQEAKKRIEDELETGNYNITLLTMAIMLGNDMGDRDYVEFCAQRFKYITEFTKSELYILAGNLSELNDNDIAYTIFRALYEEDGVEKQIAFGFAVACERKGDIDHAYDIANEVCESDGGKGPAKYFIDEMGSKTHSYMYRYEGVCEEKIYENISKENKTDLEAFEMLDYLSYASLETGLDIIRSIEPQSDFIRFELRRVAINPDVNLLIRTQAAKKINDGKTIYLNTGADIIEYSPEIEKAINDFFERERANEAVD